MSLIQLTGDKELQALFRELPNGVARTVVKTIGAKAGKLIIKEARAGTPVGKTGNLKRSLGIIRPKGRKNYVLFGPRVKAGGRNQSGFHAGWVAFGTGPRKHRKGGKHVGMMKGIGPWIQEAAARVQGQVNSLVERESGVILDKKIKQYIRRKRA